MRILVAAGLVCCCASTTFAEELTIACWNVENLFDSTRNRDTPIEDVYLPDEVSKKLEKDGEIIRLLKADIVGLVEVENRRLLRRLVDGPLKKSGYKYNTLVEGPSKRGIDCALISKRPFLAYSFGVKDFDRELLACRFVIKGQPLYVLVCHWKSRFGGGEDLRMNCARKTIEIVNEIIPRYEGKKVPVVVVGDLNDEDHDKSVKHLEANKLVNTLKQYPLHQRWTIPYYNRQTKKMQYQGFDHILVTPDLKQADSGIRLTSSEVVRPKKMIVVRKIAFYDRIYLDDDDEGKIGYSDHLPVRCRLTIGR